MTKTHRILTALLVTCGPLAFLVLESAPRIHY